MAPKMLVRRAYKAFGYRKAGRLSRRVVGSNAALAGSLAAANHNH